MSTVLEAVGDGLVVAKRNVIKIKRVPDLLVFSTMSPIMFVLLFGFVLGAGISTPGTSYKDFLMGGIFAQTMIFGAATTGHGLAEDIQRGIIDRFRSLPMARSAVLIGRTTSDLINNLLIIVIMAATGLLIGWRIRSSIWEALAAFGLLLLFAYALSWGMAIIGLAIRSAEVFGQASFVAIFPITFIANTFVPTENMPAVLRTIANWNPVSSLALACRQLFGNVPPDYVPPDVWPLQHPVIASLGFSAVMLAIFVPLAASRYKKAVAR